MTLRKTIVSTVLILILVGFTYLINNSLASKKEEKPPRVTQILPPLVQVISANPEKMNPVFNVQGVISATKTLTVSVEGTGTLNSDIELKEGVKFRKGARIAYVKDAQSLANFNSQLSLYNSKLTLLLPDIELDYPDEYKVWVAFRNEVSRGELPVLPSSVSSKLNNFLISNGVFDSYYGLKSIQATIAKRTFRAPFSGVITSVQNQKGIYVNGNAVVCNVVPVNSYEVSFSLPEEFQSIKTGTVIKVINGTDTLLSKISRVSEQIDPLSQQGKYYAQFIAKNIKLGQYVDVEISTQKSTVEAVLLPQTVVFENHIFTIQADSTLVSVPVDILGTKNDSLIVNGVKKGVLVLSEVYTNFSNGQRVRF